MTEAVEAQERDLDLLRGLPESPPRRRIAGVFLGSLGLHLLLFFVAVHLPSFASNPVTSERQAALHRTPLYMPPDLLTQRAPNRDRVSKSIDLDDLLATPNKQARKSTPAPAPSKKRFEPPKAIEQQAKAVPPAILPEPPKVQPPDQKTAPAPGVTGPLATAVPPPPKPVDSPFQNIGGAAPENPNAPLKPRTDVQSAIKGLAQENEKRNLIVTDDNAAPPAPGAPGNLGNDGGPHTAVELQSDPRGADFKAYLTRILAIVRGNWKRVIPESARMGVLRGRTTVEFIIDRDGSIPKLVIANPSGSDPLDRAAGAGLTMSNPLPPLPADYPGFQVRLAFTFSYNMPTQ